MLVGERRKEEPQQSTSMETFLFMQKSTRARLPSLPPRRKRRRLKRRRTSKRKLKELLEVEAQSEERKVERILENLRKPTLEVILFKLQALPKVLKIVQMGKKVLKELMMKKRKWKTMI